MERRTREEKEENEERGERGETEESEEREERGEKEEEREERGERGERSSWFAVALEESFDMATGSMDTKGGENWKVKFGNAWKQSDSRGFYFGAASVTICDAEAAPPIERARRPGVPRVPRCCFMMDSHCQCMTAIFSPPRPELQQCLEQRAGVARQHRARKSNCLQVSRGVSWQSATSRVLCNILIPYVPCAHTK